MTRLRRWVLHPQPGVMESLSSWLARLAECYEIRVPDLLDNSLGLTGVTVPADLDRAAPPEMLAALSERTGVELTRLRAMTFEGWVPWLFDVDVRSVSIDLIQPMFDAYVRDNSVLLAPCEAGTSQILHRRRRWAGPWHPYWPINQICPVCALDPARGTALVWSLALMTGCVEHGCRLQDAAEFSMAIALGRPPPGPVPLEEPLAIVDRYTHQALTTGRVSLPGRSVHAGIWFRLLRALLDELSLSLGQLSKAGQDTLLRVWQEAGVDQRGGVTVWAPYENLDINVQEALRRAAGTALHLAAEGTITARGRLASALQTARARYVFEGDPPSPYRAVWREAETELQAALTIARTDRDFARRLLFILTRGVRELELFEQERAYLLDAGIPAEYLPCARELGRIDLV